MTNRQSNIIFYSVISIVIYALIVNNFYPDFFENFTKSKDALSIEEAMTKGEHHKALTLYQKLAKESIGDGSENSSETAGMYEAMANLYFLMGDKVEEKNYYLKSLSIKQQLKNNNIFSISNTYNKLGSLAEEEEQYDQAQIYYEKSLSKMLGKTQEKVEGDEGMFVGMQNAQESYTRLNNEWTIAVFKKLGAIHYIKKEYIMAKIYYKKALTASKVTFGEDDIKTLEIMSSMKRLAL